MPSAATTRRRNSWPRKIADWAKHGFCSTSSAAAAAPRRTISRRSPRRSRRQARAHPGIEKKLRLSGLEPFNVGESLFVNVGERTNVTGSKAFAR